jgi:hypothetical protein
MVKIKTKYGLLLVILFSAIRNSPVFSTYSCDVYFIVYATKDGKTGHSVFAIDYYDIYVYGKMINGNMVYKYDTVKNGTLTYKWIKKDGQQISKNIKDSTGIIFIDNF